MKLAAGGARQDGQDGQLRRMAMWLCIFEIYPPARRNFLPHDSTNNLSVESVLSVTTADSQPLLTAPSTE